jgi:predicted DNA-binding transcriptional regulator YafY
MKANDTLIRHWRMLREIPRYPRRISTTELQQRLVAAGFDTTIRTIQRDLIKLSASLPLIADDAKPQGWSFEAGTLQMDLPTLEPQAALVFHLAERYLQPLLPASTLEYLSPWFRTAIGVLDNQGNGLSGWRKKVRVLSPGQPQKPPVIDSEIQSTVTQALLHGKRLDLLYRPRTANYEEKNYEANPLGLVVRDQVIYLICTLRDYNDIRQLVLSRIAKAQLLEAPVRPIKGFDIDQYIAQGEFGWLLETGKTLKLVAHFDRIVASTFIERPLDPDQIIEDIDGNTVQLTAKVLDTKEIRRWLLDFGAHAEVISPKSLRNEMKAIIQGMSQRYSRD